MKQNIFATISSIMLFDLKTNSNSFSRESLPYIPPPKYAPKRKKMVISPPISATLHRGNDLPVLDPNKPADSKNMLKVPSSSSPTPLYLRNNPIALAPSALEARKLVAECAAYASSHIPGFTPDPTDMLYDPKHLESNRPAAQSSSPVHDYDFLMNTLMLEPPTPSPPSTSPTQSTPSSPLSREGPVVSWTREKEVNSAGQNAINFIGLGTEAGSSSSHSTRAASPSLISPSNCSLKGESNVTWADDDPNYDIEGRVVKRPTGKTLVVYNTMSGDALQQQSKIARRMALVHKKKHRGGRLEESALFMDPVTGQTVDGNMMGLNYRPIPPEPKRNVRTFSNIDNKIELYCLRIIK